jgi:hypothetical protein
MGIESFCPKKVGIIFSENPHKKQRVLNFDQEACAFFLLEINKHQKTFEFQIVSPFQEAPRSSEHLEYWFSLEIKAFENSENMSHIDYWLGITSTQFHEKKGWHYYQVNNREINLDRYFWLISSYEWEKILSPPSLFEYMALSVYRCALQCLSLEFLNEKYDHENKMDKQITRGCIFDFNNWGPHRRILVANPALCFVCRSKIRKLETRISNDTKRDVFLMNELDNILNRKWMGTIDIRDSLLFNLKRLYRYDIDKNSGLYKNWIENFRDSTIDHIPKWMYKR